MIDLLVISYALMLLFHPEYTLVPSRYSSVYKSNKHRQSDVSISSSTAEADEAVTVRGVNMTKTTAAISNTTSSLRSICWTNCGQLFF